MVTSDFIFTPSNTTDVCKGVSITRLISLSFADFLPYCGSLI